ncbi:CNP1-like family protein [Vogesella sp. LIG4]|uniref:CNP1-like family protein n=1 Tax=Vogesella sp. LIG4 TaxID=1192162 RepID=UPI00081FA0A7|nr:CNP1-like family protein [Vogesella sp. LIG4]SCK10859.1 CNP1-like family protein [Vogesella sp. LIG4]
MKQLARTLTLSLLLAAAANPAHADMAKDRPDRTSRFNSYQEGPAWQEGQQALPPFPEAVKWVELPMPASIRGKIFIGIDDLQRGDDEVVRYTLRQQSSSGIDNISREGLHCMQRNLRIYAFGDTVNKRWIESQNGTWRHLTDADMLRRSLVEAMCPKGWTPPNREEILVNLNRAGGIDRSTPLDKPHKIKD